MMPSTPPPFRQGKDDNCAIACLRMILAKHGREIAEVALEEQANKQAGGMDIEELRNLAKRHALQAEIARLDLVAIAELISQNIFPIVYLNRVHIDKKFPVDRRIALRTAIIHAVVPIRLSSLFVTFNDPFTGTSRRVSRRKFEAACTDLGQWCVVCRLGGQAKRGNGLDIE